MNKRIEKVEQYKHRVLGVALEKLKNDYADADMSYRDSGQDRHYKKMTKYESEISEIEEYLNPVGAKVKELSTTQYKEFLDLKRTMQSVKSNLTYLLADLPDCTETIRLKDCMREIEDYRLDN